MGRGAKKDVLEAATVGHRITHEGDLPKPRSITALALQVLSGQPRQPGGKVSVQLGRTFTVQSLGELEGEDPGEAPDPCGVIEVGSPNTFIGKEMMPAALADEDIVIACENDSDGPILTGAKTVFVNGKPLARRTDELDCGAFVGEGDPTVFVSAERTERVVRRPPITRGPARGANVGREMQTMQNRSGVDIGRELAGADEPLRPKRRITAAARGARIARQLTETDGSRRNATLLQTLTLRP